MLIWWRKFIERVEAFVAARDFACWSAWERALALAEMCSLDDNYDEGGLYVVTGIRQRARTGTKAYVRSIQNDYATAVWVPGVRVRTGEQLILAGNFGKGRHHQEGVLYVKRLFRAPPAKIFAGWQRHIARVEQKAAMLGTETYEPPSESCHKVRQEPQFMGLVHTNTTPL